MADDDQFNEDQLNDEYQFSDSDIGNQDPLDPGLDEQETISNERKPIAPVNVKRRVLIVLGILLLAYLAYRIVSGYLSRTPVAEKPVAPRMPAVTQQRPIVTQPSRIPVSPAPVIVAKPSSISDTQIEQKLNTLESTQQTMQSNINSMNSQLTTLSAGLSDLTTRIGDLSIMVTTLAQKVELQANAMETIIERSKPKKVQKVEHHLAIPVVKYFVQAVIPGRAWLIGSNGTTLTVREGTHIHGHGVVKLIDSNQGRVVLDSGQIIRFSQQDS